MVEGRAGLFQRGEVPAGQFQADAEAHLLQPRGSQAIGRSRQEHLGAGGKVKNHFRSDPEGLAVRDPDGKVSG